jgi:hypothetical protein
MNFTALIPLPYRILAMALFAAALVGFGYVKGLARGQERIDAMVGKAATETLRIARARDKVTTVVETKYLPQAARQQVITETIIKEVPAYVPASDPDLSPGFRELHDAAAEGRLPDPARKRDGETVAAQVAADTVAQNYGVCRADQLKLQELQDWVRQQQQVK